MDLDEVIEQAKKELREEQFRRCVDEEKKRIVERSKRRLFPWKITIERRTK